MTRFDLLVRGGTVVTPTASASRTSQSATGRSASFPEITGTAREEIDARGLHVLPGVVDVHVHFNEPGGPIGRAGQLARPPVLSAARRPWPRCPSTPIRRPSMVHPSTPNSKAAEASSLVDFALWGGLTPVNLERMEELAGRGVIGFKAFMSSPESTISRWPTTPPVRRDGACGVAGLPVAVHAENDALTSRCGPAIAAGRIGAHDYLASRPAIAEIEAIARAILFAEETGCALHVVHVSTGAASPRSPPLAHVGRRDRRDLPTLSRVR